MEDWQRTSGLVEGLWTKLLAQKRRRSSGGLDDWRRTGGDLRTSAGLDELVEADKQRARGGIVQDWWKTGEVLRTSGRLGE